MPPIRRLDESVVNRIAAGEIIVHPANAIKEMVENSIDAGSTMVDVLVKEGGLKLLQVSDNGSGIANSDMHLLCERFATSKIERFDDLAHVSTYGFRGEALASISHIARLSVVSKTAESPLAYKAYYVGGKLATPKFKTDGPCDPKPIAGKNGTQITVEDLFYNVPARLRSMKSKGDEWAKILDVVGRYAVHTDGVGFSCKRFGDSHPAVTTRPQAPLKERIRTVFGTLVASELIEFAFEGTDYGVARLRGAVSGFNYTNKRTTAPVLFINNRLVSCDPLRRALNSVFQVFLPKGNHPFVYLSLDIEPENVDVNVHPTKKEVRFLHEDEIIEWICGHVHDVLESKDSSRSFRQSTFKRQSQNEVDDVVPVKKYRQENKLVRVDSQQPKISAFVKKDFQQVLRNAILEEDGTENSQKNSTSVNGHSDPMEEDTFQNEPESLQSDKQPESEISQIAVSTQATVGDSGRERSNLALDSVSELLQETKNAVDRPLTNVFNNLVYVGIVDPHKRICCFQYDVKLFLCDYAAVLADFYYQLGLMHFANFGEYVLEPTLLRDILHPLYESHTGLQSMDSVIDNIMSMEAMYKEYFQLDFSNEQLSMLPLLLKNVEPSLLKLPYFIYRLGAKVNYSDEKQCLHDILYQIALLYIPSRPDSDETTELVQQQRDHDNAVLENYVFPALRKHFVAPATLHLEVVQVADLPGLYRVFERC